MNRTREQWAGIDAKFCAIQNSATANWHLIQDAQKDIAELHQERDALLAERDVLKKDAKRYRFLMRELGGSVSQVVMGSPVFSNEDVNAAIDAALQGEQP